MTSPPRSAGGERTESAEAHVFIDAVISKHPCGGMGLLWIPHLIQKVSIPGISLWQHFASRTPFGSHLPKPKQWFSEENKPQHFYSSLASFT